MNTSKTMHPVLRYFLLVILILVLLILQTTVMHTIKLFHVIPNLLFITVVCYSLKKGDMSAFFVSIFCGILMDIIGTRTLGLNTLLFSLTTYFCLCVCGNLFNINTLVSMVFVLLLTIPYELLIYIFHFAIWGEGHFGYALLCKILPGAIYNFLVTAIMYPVIKKLAQSEQ